MATELLFSELKTWLDAQPENTASTPYEIIIKDAPKGATNYYTNKITRFVNIVGMEMKTGVTAIGQESFLMCTNLVGITVPAGITTINFQAFQGCTNLISVVLPGSLTTINNRAFLGCNGLKSINIPYGVTTIGEGALRNCYNLGVIELPGTLTSVGDNAFYSCTSLSIVYAYTLFSETLMQPDSFSRTPSNLRVLVHPAYLSSWQSASLTSYGFAPGVKAESLYTKWVRFA